MSSDVRLIQPSQAPANAAGQDAPRCHQHEGIEENQATEITQLVAERDHLRAEIEALRTQHAKTASALADITNERDVYHAELMFRMRNEVTFTDEDIEKTIKNAVPLGDLLHELGLDLDDED